MLTSSNALANYDFAELKNCFSKTQAAKNTASPIRFVSTVKDRIAEGAYEIQKTDALVITEPVSAGIKVHFIQDFGRRPENGAGRTSRKRASNVRLSFFIWESDLDKNCNAKDPSKAIKLGGSCTSPSEKRCPPLTTIFAITKQGTCNFQGTIAKDTSLTYPIDIDQKTANQLVKNTLKKHLETLSEKIDNSPGDYDMNQVRQALYSPGHCLKIFRSNEPVINSKVASLLCEPPIRNREVCQITDTPAFPQTPVIDNDSLGIPAAVPANYVPVNDQ